MDIWKSTYMTINLSLKITLALPSVSDWVTELQNGRSLLSSNLIQAHKHCKPLDSCLNTFAPSVCFFTPSPNQNHVNNLLKTCYKNNIANIFLKHEKDCNYKLSKSRWGWSTVNKHRNTFSTSLMFSCLKERRINDIFCTVSDSEVPFSFSPVL